MSITGTSTKIRSTEKTSRRDEKERPRFETVFRKRDSEYDLLTQARKTQENDQR